MKVSLLIEIDKEEKLDECQDFSSVLFPISLLKKHIDHYYDELSYVYRPFIQIESFFDLS